MAGRGEKRSGSWNSRSRKRIVDRAGDSPEPPGSSTLSHTFDIRFAPSAGLAALLAQPSNTLRWKGSGRINIQPGAITIAVNRGLLSQGGTRRIAAGQLREVYREGNAVRLEFSGADNSREILPLWADDREVAAEIVRLLPTERTVEVELPARAPKFRPDPRAFGGLLALAIVIVGAVVGLRRSEVAPPPVTAAPEVEAAPVEARPAPATPELATVEIPEAELPVRFDEPVVPIPPGTRAHKFAVAQVALFDKQAVALLEEYRLYRTMLEDDALTFDGYIAKLEGPLEGGWWAVTFRILEDPAYDAPELVGLRATQLAAARHWRAFIELYVEGLRTQDRTLIPRAFDLLSRAEWMQVRARQYVQVPGGSGAGAKSGD